MQRRVAVGWHGEIEIAGGDKAERMLIMTDSFAALARPACSKAAGRPRGLRRLLRRGGFAP